MTLKPGVLLFTVVCTTELIAVKAPGGPVDLGIGGVPPVGSAAERTQTDSVPDAHGGGAAMRKRCVDSSETIERLCTKPGDGVPALGDELLQLKEAKPLPASD